MKNSFTSGKEVTAFGKWTKCRTKRSNSSRLAECVEVVGNNVTLRDRRGMRLKRADGSFGSGDALGNTFASL